LQKYFEQLTDFADRQGLDLANLGLDPNLGLRAEQKKIAIQHF
jgi:hypothetical protein